jgi:Flp pilus assembly CpaE family ATPase
MRKELDINIENAYLIINRLQGELPAALKTFAENLDVPLLGTIPADEAALAEFEFSGKPLVELGDESPVYRAVEGMMRQVLKEKPA